RDWDAMAELLADDISSDDRRPVVSAGIRRGRDAEIANWRARGDIWSTNVRSTVATRGKRLALIRFAFASQDQPPEAFSTAALGIVEINADNRIAAIVVFDLDEIDAAFAELDARYLAGEAAAHSHTWSAITATYAAVNRGEIPATAPDLVDIDHRLVAAIGPGDVKAYLRAALGDSVDNRVYIEAVHRLTDLGAIVAHAAHGTSRDGGLKAEWRMANVIQVEGDLISRYEMFDESDLDAALTRFEALHPPARQLENAASQATERLWSYFATRSWAEMAEMMADDVLTVDRGGVVNAGVIRGREVNVANMRAVAKIGFEDIASTVIATRGQRLALIRIRSSAHGFEPGE